MNNAAAAPAATTAPVTRTGQESKEDTMITLAAAVAAVEAIEAEVHDLMACDDTAFDADLAARHEQALRDLRAAQAQVTAPAAVKWVVLGHRSATRRTLKWVGLATSREDARAQAVAKWTPRGFFMIDRIGEAVC